VAVAGWFKDEMIRLAECTRGREGRQSHPGPVANSALGVGLSYQHLEI
jgi:hypothetical protein